MSIDLRQRGRHERRSVAESGRPAAHRSHVNDVDIGDELLDGVERAATTLRMLVDDITAGRCPDGGVVDECRESLRGVLAERADEPVVIAIQEEARGLLAELIDIADDPTLSGSTVLAESVSTHEAADNSTRPFSYARR